jgi:hypothetical protein
MWNLWAGRHLGVGWLVCQEKCQVTRADRYKMVGFPLVSILSISSFLAFILTVSTSLKASPLISQLYPSQFACGRGTNTFFQVPNNIKRQSLSSVTRPKCLIQSEGASRSFSTSESCFESLRATRHFSDPRQYQVELGAQPLSQ